MKIRYRITLWITFAGILASLALSSIVFFEMVDEPYELLDQELDANARALAANLQLLSNSSLSLENNIGQLNTPYWVRVTDRKHGVLFQSEMAGMVDLPLEDSENGYSVNTDISLTEIAPELEDELATFRVRVFKYTLGAQDYVFQIARPVENLNQEIVELLITIELGLAVSALVLILVSYYVAGRILQPIQTINDTAQQFNEKSLDRRIPLSENQDELYELSSALNAMLDRLEYSFMRQKEFIANASHELKTPITMLRLSLEEFLEDDGIPESYQQLFEKQNKTILRMDRLVKSLLDLSSLELVETITPAFFSLNELVDSVVVDFQPLMNRQEVQFVAQVDEDINVNGDREKLKRVFINLFENAIKYNREDGEIRLQVQCGGYNRNVIVSLFNTGPGVPLEDHGRVFEQFYRVEKSRSSALGGSGLGLTIVKRIVELHGGTVSMDSKPGEWTQIHISLPIAAKSN